MSSGGVGRGGVRVWFQQSLISGEGTLIGTASGLDLLQLQTSVAGAACRIQAERWGGGSRRRRWCWLAPLHLPRHSGRFPANQHELSAPFFSGEALGAIGNPEVLEILKQYSTDPVIEVTQPLPHTPSDPVPGCQGNHLAQGCQERTTAPLGKAELLIHV